MGTALAVGSGVFWTVTYVLVIRVGLRDRSYGMPLVALGANLSWEFIFSFVRPHDGVQHVIDLVWLALDCGILWTVLRFGPREFRWLSCRAFPALVAGTIGLSYLGVDAVCRQFDAGAGTFAAFGQNLMMSGLFLGMLLTRRSTRGQSLGIAVCKLVGTALASADTWLGRADEPLHHGPLLPYLFVSILLLDLAYAVALAAVGRAGTADR
ncbi:hypothetical protein ACIGXM_18670 [Kitasatospora sp. NPDC052896]|uniref:transmembrane-type terpene cyclase n=1 Tax=Kitasatospora sp. NPDC052896 TaxID=3364061 RepID=UPI0037C76886